MFWKWKKKVDSISKEKNLSSKIKNNDLLLYIVKKKKKKKKKK